MLTSSRAVRRPLRCILATAAALSFGCAMTPLAFGVETLPFPTAGMQEFTLVSPSANGAEFAFGPEGGIWYAGPSNDLERVTTEGLPTADFKVEYGKELLLPASGGYVEDLSRGSDGAMWFIDQPAEFDLPPVLMRMNTIGATKEYLPVGEHGHISSLAGGPAAAVWFTANDASGNAEIGRITGAGTVETFDVPSGDGVDVAHESDPGPLIAGADGNMWFIDYGRNTEGHNLIGRVTPAGNAAEFPLPDYLPYPQSLASGPAGAVWVESPEGVIYRVSTNGTVSSYALPHFGGHTVGLAAGPEGNLWYVNSSSADETFGTVLGRITPDGQGTLFLGPSRWGEPTLGPDGRLWFGEAAGYYPERFLSVLPPLAPTVVSLPSITGEATEGHLLSATPGSWDHNPSAFAYQWYLCDSAGADCERAIQQTGSSIPLLGASVGRTLRVTVTASGPGGSTTATSAASALVRAVGPKGATQGEQLGFKAALPPTLFTTMTWQFGWSRRGTTVRALRLHRVPAGAQLEVLCNGRGCGFAQRRIRPLAGPALRRCKAGPCLPARGGDVELSSLWKHHRLAPKATVEVVVIRAGYRGKLFRYVTRRSGPPRSPNITCLSPGSTKVTVEC